MCRDLPSVAFSLKLLNFLGGNLVAKPEICDAGVSAHVFA